MMSDYKLYFIFFFVKRRVLAKSLLHVISYPNWFSLFFFSSISISCLFFIMKF